LPIGHHGCPLRSPPRVDVSGLCGLGRERTEHPCHFTEAGHECGKSLIAGSKQDIIRASFGGNHSFIHEDDLVGDFVCRLLKHMEAKGAKKVEVALRPEDKDMKLLAWMDDDDFNPGYMKRGVHLWSKRGDKKEWAHTQNYWREKDEIPAIDLDGAEFVYH
jgi:hypothetical protein